ncbi:hypothetical protein [Aminobacter ciceronei]|uniref:Uncharacterized protein n=1 Tax=Aminobacter ciceronei TaxID=150723 RepID=A0ABR6CAY3_9HYPH|nr:hypothetical protein [Aminobacter ciceronei]MBA8907950.1 hypothetical protein [Aminobacter ciceronei]MBA9021705.1 hypothetical protein [Aminobacter ciceronei]
MTHRNFISVDGGSAEYWRQRKQAFRLIREAERAAEDLARAPIYIRGRWDDEYGDYEPVENLGPHDDMDDAIRAIEADETAVGILVAQRRAQIGNHPVTAVIRALAQLDVSGIDEDVEGDYERLHGPDW